MPRSQCKACGDDYELSRRAARFELAGLSLAPGEEDYCDECADELFREQISTRPARLFSGNRTRGENEPSPWGENAVREMEA